LPALTLCDLPALKYHPDRNRGAEDLDACVAKFQAIQEAHEVLIDPVERRTYDTARRKIAYGGFQSSAYGQDRPKTYGNRYQAHSDFAPPPKAPAYNPYGNQRPSPPKSTPSTANTYQKYAQAFKQGKKDTNTRKDDARSRENVTRAWEQMGGKGKPAVPPRAGPFRSTGGSTSGYTSPEPRNNDDHAGPPRAKSHNSMNQEPGSTNPHAADGMPAPGVGRSQSTRVPKRNGFDPSTPGGDEPAAKSAYNHTHGSRPTSSDAFVDPANAPRRAAPTSKKPDPYSAFREQVEKNGGLDGDSSGGYEERLSSPYATSGGEKTYFSNLGRSASTKGTSSHTEAQTGPGSSNLHHSHTVNSPQRPAGPHRRPPVPLVPQYTSSGSSEDDAQRSKLHPEAARRSGPTKNGVPKRAPYTEAASSNDDDIYQPRSPTARAKAKPRTRRMGTDRYPDYTANPPHAPELPGNKPPPAAGPPPAGHTQHPTSPMYGVPVFSNLKDSVLWSHRGGVSDRISGTGSWDSGSSSPPESQKLESLINPISYPSLGLNRVSYNATQAYKPHSDRFNAPPPQNNYVPGTHPPAEPRTLSSDSIDTAFSPDEWNGQFQASHFWDGKSRPDTKNQSRRPISPTKPRPQHAPMKPGPSSSSSSFDSLGEVKQSFAHAPDPPSAVPYTSGAPPFHSTPNTFSPHEWTEGFNLAPQNVPAPGTTQSFSLNGSSQKSKSRTGSRSTARKPIPKAQPASASSASDDPENIYYNATKSPEDTPVNSYDGGKSTSSLNSAMDIDPATPNNGAPEGSGKSTSTGLNPTVEPVVDNEAPVNTQEKMPNLPPRRHLTTEEPEIDFGLGNLKNIAPLSGHTSGDGLESLRGDLDSTLPFQSRASSAHPGGEVEPQKLNLPQPPKVPLPPTKLSNEAWLIYVRQFQLYMDKWNFFNGQMLTHFNARHSANDDLSRNWLGIAGEGAHGGLLKYMKGVEEDVRVRNHFDVAWDKHRDNMLTYKSVKDKMLEKIDFTRYEVTG
jgi:curved DNA-binding protein CbpA